MTSDRQYIMSNGRILDFEGCRDYIAKESTEQQIAAWIDANEPPHDLMAYTFNASSIALALVEWDQLRTDIADFIYDNEYEDGLVFFNILPLASSSNSKSKDRLDKAFKQSGSKPRKNTKIKFRRK